MSANPDAPDHQALLRTFEPLTAMLKAKPRDDRPGAQPDPGTGRAAQ